MELLLISRVAPTKLRSRATVVFFKRAALPCGLTRSVRGEAVLEWLGALLAPVAAPVAVVGAEAVEAGKDVEGVPPLRASRSGGGELPTEWVTQDTASGTSCAISVTRGRKKRNAAALRW
jgi:hypothetical protein